MARKSIIARQVKREAMVAKFATRRAELKATINNPKSSIEEVDVAVLKLHQRKYLNQNLPNIG